MSEENAADRLDQSARQYGEEIVEQGEPFDGETLDAIRNLVAQNDDFANASSSEEPVVAHTIRRRGLLSAMVGDRYLADPIESQRHAPGDEGRQEIDSGSSCKRDLENSELVDVPTSIDGPHARVRTGRAAGILRALLTPRGLSILCLAAVTIWRPWFIPSLALVIALLLFFLPLFVGVFIGQDRMGRFLLKLTKKYIWADPGRGRALQKVLPRRLHPFLYRPMGDGDAWDGLIDPSFEARLARLRG